MWQHDVGFSSIVEQLQLLLISSDSSAAYKVCAPLAFSDPDMPCSSIFTFSIDIWLITVGKHEAACKDMRTFDLICMSIAVCACANNIKQQIMFFILDSIWCVLFSGMPYEPWAFTRWKTGVEGHTWIDHHWTGSNSVQVELGTLVVLELPWKVKYWQTMAWTATWSQPDDPVYPVPCHTLLLSPNINEFSIVFYSFFMFFQYCSLMFFCSERYVVEAPFLRCFQNLCISSMSSLQSRIVQCWQLCSISCKSSAFML